MTSLLAPLLPSWPEMLFCSLGLHAIVWLVLYLLFPHLLFRSSRVQVELDVVRARCVLVCPAGAQAIERWYATPFNVPGANQKRVGRSVMTLRYNTKAIIGLSSDEAFQY